jgi:hypothetical protein
LSTARAETRRVYTMTQHSLGVKTVDLHEQMKEMRKQERSARECKENTARQIRLNEAVGTVGQGSMSALIAALKTIEEIGERLHKSPSMRSWGIRLTDAAQDIRDSIYLED